jgi:hypothetical protein
MSRAIVVAVRMPARYARAIADRVTPARGVEEGVVMSFIKRAQEAAVQAAEVARSRAEAAGRTANDPATAEMLGKGAREAVGLARKGVTTVIERIDPSTLAELIVRATALQEMTNKSLRQKGSPYRISEISISASIPPAVAFAISRLDEEPEEVGDAVVSSSELIEQSAEAGELVLALDGTTIDEAAASVEAAALEAAAVKAAGAPIEGAMPPSSISRG